MFIKCNRNAYVTHLYFDVFLTAIKNTLIQWGFPSAKEICSFIQPLEFTNLHLHYFFSLSQRTADTMPQLPLALGLRHFAVSMLRRYSRASENVPKRF